MTTLMWTTVLWNVPAKKWFNTIKKKNVPCDVIQESPFVYKDFRRCLCTSAMPLKSPVPPKHLRGVWFCVTLQEEAHALLVWPVRIEARHHHYLPRKVPDEAGRAEHRLTQTAEAFHHEAKSCLWPPTGVYGRMVGKKVVNSEQVSTSFH